MRAACGAKSRLALPKVRAWSHVTKRGDIAELPGLGEADPVWPWVTSTRENCLGARVPGVRRVLRARGAARGAGGRHRRREPLPADGRPRAQGGGLRRPAAGRRRDRHRRGAPVAGRGGAVPRLQRQHAPAVGDLRRTWRASCCSRSRWAAASMPRSPALDAQVAAVHRRDGRRRGAARARAVARAPARGA